MLCDVVRHASHGNQARDFSLLAGQARQEADLGRAFSAMRIDSEIHSGRHQVDLASRLGFHGRF